MSVTSPLTYQIQPAHLPRPVSVTLARDQDAKAGDIWWGWTTSYDGKEWDRGYADTEEGARQDAEVSVEPDVFSPLPDGEKPATALILTAQGWLRAAKTQPGQATQMLHNAFNHTDNWAWVAASLLILLREGNPAYAPRIDFILKQLSPEARVSLGLDQPTTP